MSAIRKLPTNVNKNRVHSIACLGDSLTDPTANMGPEWTRWTQLLQHRLQAAGANVKVRNSGRRRREDGSHHLQGHAAPDPALRAQSSRE